MPWKSPFELEIPGRSPHELADVSSGGRFRLFGLRLRVKGNRLRARYVAVDGASAPLLRATLVPSGSGTRVVGHVYWAAMYVSDVMYVLFAFVGGLALVTFLVVTQDWSPVLVLAPVVLTGGWVALSLRDTDEVRGGYEVWFRESLLEMSQR